MWRKYLVAVLLAVLGIAAIWFFVGQISQPAVAESDYAKAVKDFQEISIEDLEEKLGTDEDFILYIGRETCPYCRAFVPKLHQAAKETEIPVLYIDSDEDPTGKLELFRQASGIKTVPSLTYFKDGKLSAFLQKGSQATKEEITQFLQLLSE
ncbi:TPA: thioredoxin domain-containing protein [Streptococcus suis]|uniref:thioredoxin domain-containing protein n=1 Tax=Streptococcus suis TaxID=1307 RepID=UPI000CF455AA|nr:thioredoxin domain-containing protein [Streptococcus suis]